MQREQINSLLEKLASFTATPGAGVTRFSYSPEDRLARQLVAGELAALGCETWTDPSGTIHGLFAGQNPDSPAVMIGSHLDSVRNGGRFDGAVGVVGALAVLARFREAGIKPERNVRFVAFAEEEGSNFSIPLLGSKLFTGEMTPADLASVVDANGVNARERIGPAAGDAGSAPEWAAPGTIGQMLELHVEQGPTLDAENIDIGVVDCIAADVVLSFSVRGRSGHSGATPMTGRRDALAGAAEMAVRCEAIALSPEGKGSVVTVGKFDCQPNAFNCIAERVDFTIDIRSPSPETVKTVRAIVENQLRETAANRGLDLFANGKFTPGVTLDEGIRDTIAAAAGECGYSSREVTSWAMHDAGTLARIAAVGMIFVPSLDGVSHNPGEFTSAEAVFRGVNVLFRATAVLSGADIKNSDKTWVGRQ